MADADNDGIAVTYEEFFGFSDSNPTDALLDADADGLSNYEEFVNSTNPINIDTDGDGLTDGREVFGGFGPHSFVDSDNDGFGDDWEMFFFANLLTDGSGDSDQDGLTDAEEWALYTDPTHSDSDGDGLEDYEEINTYGTSPIRVDTDGDGLADGWELDNGFDPLASGEEVLDGDFDNLINLQEFQLGTNPLLADTDGDNVNDDLDSHPLDANEQSDNDADGIGDNADTDDDNDGFSDDDEINVFGSDPLVANTNVDGDEYPDRYDSDNDNDGVDDTNDAFPLDPSESLDTDLDGIGNNADEDDDNDGLLDTIETQLGSNALLADTDQDGLSDLYEFENGLDLLVDDAANDPDADGLSNVAEYEAGTSPQLADTDGDTYLDGWELANGYSPLIPRYQVALAENHACMLEDGGEITCWGNEENGQTVVPSIANATSIAAADYSYSCAANDAGIECWGRSYSNSLNPPNMQNVTAMASGFYHTCAANAEEVSCWGYDVYGGTYAPDISGVKKLALGYYQSCALTESGVTCWGGGSEEAESQNLINPVDLSAGRNHVCAVDDSGVTCWGNNSYNQLDVPDLINPTRVASGFEHNCALDSNGVVCWGSNESAQLDVPSLLNPYNVFAAGNYSCALDDTGLVCWGARYNSNFDYYVPPDTDGDGVIDEDEIAAGFDINNPNDVGLDTDGDGLTAYEEYLLGTDNNLADTDGDLIADAIDQYPLNASRFVQIGTGSVLVVSSHSGNLDGYEGALKSIGYDVSTLIADGEGGISFEQLDGFNKVYWRDDGIISGGESVMRNYLDSGRCIVVDSEDFGYYWGGALPNEYFGLGEILYAGSFGTISAAGSLEDEIGELEAENSEESTSPVPSSSQYYSDFAWQPDENAEAILNGVASETIYPLALHNYSSEVGYHAYLLGVGLPILGETNFKKVAGAIFNQCTSEEEALNKLDSDSDGLPDVFEQAYGTDINLVDTDGDGLSDYQELANRLNPLVADDIEALGDSDGDGLSTYDELNLGLDPFNPDSDGDGLTDLVEYNSGIYDPLNPDTNGNQFSDGFEYNYGSDLLLDGDEDNDGLTNLEESNAGSSPFSTDVDGDQLSDVYEIQRGLHPGKFDSDGDGWSDSFAIRYGINFDPTADEDGDGLTNSEENIAGSSPFESDTDRDGLSDYYEAKMSFTLSYASDSDGDGVSDIRELFITNTNPLDADSAIALQNNISTIAVYLNDLSAEIYSQDGSLNLGWQGSYLLSSTSSKLSVNGVALSSNNAIQRCAFYQANYLSCSYNDAFSHVESEETWSLVPHVIDQILVSREITIPNLDYGLVRYVDSFQNIGTEEKTISVDITNTYAAANNNVRIHTSNGQDYLTASDQYSVFSDYSNTYSAIAHVYSDGSTVAPTGIGHSGRGDWQLGYSDVTLQPGQTKRLVHAYYVHNSYEELLQAANDAANNHGSNILQGISSEEKSELINFSVCAINDTEGPCQ